MSANCRENPGRASPLIAEKTFRRLDAPELLADVASGVVYINGVHAVNRGEKKVRRLISFTHFLTEPLPTVSTSLEVFAQHLVGRSSSAVTYASFGASDKIQTISLYDSS